MANIFEKMFKGGGSAVEETPNEEKKMKMERLKERKDILLKGIEFNGGRWTIEDRELMDRLEAEIKELEEK
jgi:hypothetical protein